MLPVAISYGTVPNENGSGGLELAQETCRRLSHNQLARAADFCVVLAGNGFYIATGQLTPHPFIGRETQLGQTKIQKFGMAAIGNEVYCSA